MTSSDNPTPARRTGWNTYYPWLLALWGTLSALILFVIVISWMPSPEIPGVPPSPMSFPMVPGLLGILFFVMTGRQLYLRSQVKQ